MQVDLAVRWNSVEFKKAFGRSQRMMARRKEDGLPAQDDGGGEISHRRVATIDEA
jgi:hypothetical protein